MGPGGDPQSCLGQGLWGVWAKSVAPLSRVMAAVTGACYKCSREHQALCNLHSRAGAVGWVQEPVLTFYAWRGKKPTKKNDERAHNQQATETKQSHGLKIQAISPCPPPILTLYSVVPRDSRVASKQLTRRAQRHWEKGTSYAKAFRINSAAALKALRNRAPPLHHS